MVLKYLMGYTNFIVCPEFHCFAIGNERKQTITQPFVESQQ